MDILKWPFNKELKFIWIKFSNLNTELKNLIISKFRLLNYNNLKIDSSDDELKIIAIKSSNFEVINLCKLIDFFIKIDWIVFKIYLIYLDINSIYPSIIVTKIDYINKFFNYNLKKYNNLFCFLKNKEIFYKLFKVFLNENLNKNIKKENLGKKNCINIQNFKDFNIELSKLLSLLSIFGNINLIYFNYLNGNILIEFNEEIDAKKLLKCKKIIYINNNQIEMSLVNKEVRTYNNFNIFKKLKINNKTNRYNNKVKTKYNAPSSIINISNISYHLKINKIYQIVSAYCDPLLLKFNFTKNGKTKMCLVKCNNITDSIKLIINLNNKTLGKRKIKVAFSFNNFKI